MPNRILRDWTDSETIDQLTIQGERFFTRLIMKADDYGRYSANVKILKSTLFPLKTDVRETDISLWLAECKQCGLIALYNVASKEFVQINNFRQVLRQKIEKYPSPDAQTHSICVADDKQMTSNGIHEKKRNESEKKRKEYLGDKSPPKKSFKTWDLADFKQEITANKEVLGLPPDEENLLLSDFFKYWNEKSPIGKMRFQLEKTWETQKRLVTWYNNKIEWKRK